MDRCFWHSPQPPFQECDYREDSSCNPLQQVVTSGNWGTFRNSALRHPRTLLTEGAIIFGEKTSDLVLTETGGVEDTGATGRHKTSQYLPPVHLSDEASIAQGHFEQSRLHSQPRLRRCAKTENLRHNIGQSISSRQDQNIHE